MSEIQIGFFHVKVQLKISSDTKIHIGMTSSRPEMRSSKIIRFLHNSRKFSQFQTLKLADNDVIGPN